MAKTKRSLRILKGASPYLNACVNIANEADAITLADMGATIDTATGIPVGSYYVPYQVAVAGEVTVDFSAITSGTAHTEGIDFEITLIDVTSGREQMPRRTFTAATGAALQTAINNATIEAGDGKEYVAAWDAATNVVTITMPDDVITRVAASDGAVITETQAPSLHEGLTRAEAVEYCKQMAAVQYGRTNRVKFPVVEPNVEATLGTHPTWGLLVVPKLSEVKFDKNFGAGYQDIEYFEFLINDGTNGVTLEAGTPLADAAP
jgi:hypothetical protein